MAKHNRNTLKSYFSKGRMPSEKDFSDLIDSMLNTLDEGFDKTADDGFQVTQIGQHGKLMSFYKNTSVLSPIWSIKLNPLTDSLVFGSDSNDSVLTLSCPENPGAEAPGSKPAMAIGINNDDPRVELDVAGTVGAHGRLGRRGRPVRADGGWHDITETLDGCQAFEIMAGVGRKNSGKYAILHAFALNAFNSKSHITYHQAHFDSRCNRMELRWNGDIHNYTLQLRTRCGYEPGVYVNYYITRLWFDPYMNECQHIQTEGEE